MPTDIRHLRMSGSPQAILSKMIEMEPKIRRAQLRLKRLRVAAVALMVAGFVPYLFLFSWRWDPLPLLIAPLILMPIEVWLFERSSPYELYPRYEMARELLSALQDDAERVVGLLDLTRPTERSKRVRTARSWGHKSKAYYRNPWLRIKLRLVDGNTLRFSLVDKVKTKASSVVRRTTKITAKLVINTDLYAQSEALSELHVPRYEVSSGPDHVLLTGYLADAQDLSAQQLLSKIQTLFGYLEPVGQAVV